jgi:hypothetical protein
MKMANKATIQRESFYKSLSRLESMAKSQICTGPNSEVKTWPGGESSDVPGDGPGADKIKEDGTDYNERGGKAVRKSIREKVKKGFALSVQELALLKSDIESAEKAGPMGGGGGAGGMGKPPIPGMGKSKDDDEDDKGGDKDKDDDKDKNPFFGKSFQNAAQQSETIQKGVEVSEFLSELAKAFGEGLQGIEARTHSLVENLGQQVFGALNQFAGEQGEFNKSLAEAVANIGYGVAGSMEQVEQVAQMPASGPKGQMQVIQGGGQGFVNKSFGGPGGETLDKSQVLDIMQDMLEKGQLTPLDIIKFDTTGDMRQDLGPRILAKARQG